MNQAFIDLNSIPPTTVWGLLTRSLGLLYLIAIGSFYRQIILFAGKDGLGPARDLFDKIQKDFPTAKRFFYFPSYCWISQSDRFLKSLVLIGMGAALYVTYGGPYSTLALFICWSIFLSLDHILFLAFPWDCLLLEAGFLALFLPATHALPELASVTSPHLLCALAFQFLVFRVIFGFGKFKFHQTNAKEIGYLKYFFINQPIPTICAWFGFRLPFWVFKVLITYMFLVEIIIPFFIFFPGPLRLIACFAICFLMIGIQLTGNYGYFNLLTIAVCISLLDTNISFLQINPNELFSDLPTSLASVLLLIHLIGGLVYLPFNNWCTRTWIHWVSLMRINNRPLQWLLKFYRALSGFRFVHGYGVFPPYSAPGVRWVPLIEGSHDGKVWKEYEYHFIPSHEKSPPKFIAPYHPRFDHMVFYESPGFNGSNFFVANVGFNNPYTFSKVYLFARVFQRLLEGNKLAHQLFKTNPFPDADNPPKMIRVRNFMLAPTSIQHQRQTGEWYKRIYVGTHYPVIEKDDSVWQRALPDPENFHWDDWIWKYRSASTQTMLKKFKSCQNPDDAVCSLPEISREDINTFWHEFLPQTMPDNKRDFKNLKTVYERIQKTYDWQMIKKFERIFSAYSILVFDNLSENFFNKKQPFLKVKSSFHLALIIYTALSGGKDSYKQLFNNPELINEKKFDNPYLKTSPLYQGLYFLGIFHYDTLAYHARRIRVTQRISDIASTPEISGFFELIPFIICQFEPDPDEDIPIFSRKIKDGQWEVQQ